MKNDRLYRFFDGLMEAFLNERQEEFQRHFVFPVVVYSVAGVTLIRDPEELLRITGLYRDALRKTAMVATNFDIEKQDQPKNNRMRVTLSFSDNGPEGERYTGSVIRYFLHDGPSGYKIEMMEYLEVVLGVSELERIVH